MDRSTTARLTGSAAQRNEAPEPRHCARATRSAGRVRRSELLDGASALFRQRGLAAVSIAEIAAAANAFPSQITYYFRTKEALFVEAACRELLYLGSAAEREANQRRSPDDYTRALVEQVMESEAIGFFVEALVLTRRRQDLAPLIERTIERLHAEGLRAYANAMTTQGWHSQADHAISARRFWAIAIGVAIEGQATGRSSQAMTDDMLRLLGPQAITVPAEATTTTMPARLSVVPCAEDLALTERSAPANAPTKEKEANP